MISKNSKLRLFLIPLGVFLAVFGIHYLLSGIFPESSTAQSQWANIQTDWFKTYIANQNYWLGFSYALSLAFAAYAILRFLQNRANNSRKLAIGSIGYTGMITAAGCFLLGCCGSPMLAVYISLFGNAFLSFIPFMKPLVALITLISISIGFVWMKRWGKSEVDCGCAKCDGGETKGTLFKIR